MRTSNYTICPLGDSAITIDFGNSIDIELNKIVLELFHQIRTAYLIGVKDIVASYSAVTVHYDVVTLSKHYHHISAYNALKRELENLILQKAETLEQVSRDIRIPVCYEEKYGLDLQEVAGLTSLSVKKIIEIHTSKKYRVYMIGFLPGFAYMGEVDKRIAVPRKQEPRVEIEAGYVGIAGGQTGIYPLTSPGGWQIIGRTPLKMFNKEEEEPVLLKAGDEVEFFSITEDEFKNY